MGATEFSNSISAKTAEEAFRTLVEEARWEHGNGGYTGTLAEKHDFRMVTPMRRESPEACAAHILDEACSNDDRVGGKWGPAACLDLGPDEGSPGLRRFRFFGWASE